MRLFIPTSAALLLLAFAPAPDDPCLRCHGNLPPATVTGAPSDAPLLPDAFVMSWDMYEFESSARPPVDPIPTPHSVIHGSTAYDWHRRSMTEIYQDKCIDIFPAGRDFPCQFLSVADRTYFIRFAAGTTTQVESCCLWQQAHFWAPRPDVLRTMVFDRDGPENTRWWTLDIPPPGPFGYGISNGQPTAFWFPVISGWVQQVFHDFRPVEPAPSAFTLPSACQAQPLPVCS